MGSSESAAASLERDIRPSAVTDRALKHPLSISLSGKRVVLASASPRRKEILSSILGLEPEIVPSTFDELLSHNDFVEDLSQYAAATATSKAIEVYERMVRQSPEDPPDLIISADTVCILEDQIMEKPGNASENMRMLLDLNGRMHQVWTGVTILVPGLTAPGYVTRSLLERTEVYFAENPTSLLQAYVDCGEGVDRAGGFAIQGRGGLLVQRINGDYNNVVGFPASAFFKFLSDLIADGDLWQDQ